MPPALGSLAPVRLLSPPPALGSLQELGAQARLVGLAVSQVALCPVWPWGFAEIEAFRPWIRASHGSHASVQGSRP